ncbi:MAG: hypothetical protein WCK47_13675, partial [bacterium]
LSSSGPTQTTTPPNPAPSSTTSKYKSSPHKHGSHVASLRGWQSLLSFVPPFIAVALNSVTPVRRSQPLPSGYLGRALHPQII